MSLPSSQKHSSYEERIAVEKLCCGDVLCCDKQTKPKQRKPGEEEEDCEFFSCSKWLEQRKCEMQLPDELTLPFMVWQGQILEKKVCVSSIASSLSFTLSFSPRDREETPGQTLTSGAVRPLFRHGFPEGQVSAVCSAPIGRRDRWQGGQPVGLGSLNGEHAHYAVSLALRQLLLRGIARRYPDGVLMVLPCGTFAGARSAVRATMLALSVALALALGRGRLRCARATVRFLDSGHLRV
ncbi:hypothetical protein EYF80_033399 [Liparis tanakae]|uniref:Uncharacterized protein n=1 Tax=Liparis tanakae TaxID=230148 RepID=A0A4Z2GUE1_9TELE|nr:hypothetical protein EYF80_033399 [Liparis tanakae]